MDLLQCLGGSVGTPNYSDAFTSRLRRHEAHSPSFAGGCGGFIALLGLEELLFGNMLVASFLVCVIVLFNLKGRSLHFSDVKLFIVHSIASLGMADEIFGIVTTKVWGNFGLA